METTIPVTCSCGKEGAFPASMAGRSVRCGRCQESLTVPAYVPASPRPHRPGRAALVALLVPVAAGLFVLGRWTGQAPPPNPAVPAPEPPPADPFSVVAALPAPKAEADPADRSSWPPQLVAAEKFLRKYTNDPKSFEVVEWWKPVPYPNGAQLDPVRDEVIHLTVRERNEHGALFVAPVLVYFNEGKVVHIKNTSDPGFWASRSFHYAPRADNNPLGGLLQDLANPQGGPRATPKR